MFADVEGDFTDRWIEDRTPLSNLALFGMVFHVMGTAGLVIIAFEAIDKVLSR